MSRRKKYDVFLSYARADDDRRHVGSLADEMRNIFSRRTGHKLKLFQDKTEIHTADMWEERVGAALGASAVLVPVISRAYFASEWCRREWNHFAAAERALASAAHARLIYPVLLNGMPKVRGPDMAQQWLGEVSARQSLDLAGSPPGSHQHAAQVQFLMDGIMSRLHQINAEPPATGQGQAVEHRDVFVGQVGEGARFIDLLAQALNVTIVGLTNENLAAALSKALERKRRASGDGEDFWRSLRIVFLSDRLLDSLNDTPTDVPDRAEALLRRRLAAGYGLRSIRVLLEHVQYSHWELYESRYQLPFAGTLFEMPGGKRTVQLLLRRPQRRAQNQLYMEFAVGADQYMAGAFEDVVGSSTPLRSIIPVGVPREGGVFRCTSRRFREQVLRDGSRQSGWLPVVLLAAWRQLDGGRELVLQLRTAENSHRELNRLAHLTNYLLQDDIIGAGGGGAENAGPFDLSQDMLRRAARRTAEVEIGPDLADGLELDPECFRTYLHPDKENLFFYVFSAELPSHYEFLQQAEMRGAPIGGLLALREKQALRGALAVCRQARRPAGVAPAAAEIAALNLHVHGHHEMAEEVLASPREKTRLEGAARRIALLDGQTRQIRHSDGQQVELAGLAGLLFREFFTTFLPLYEKLGVPEAADALEAVDSSGARRSARDRLAGLYTDEAVMGSIPPSLDL